MVVVRARAEVPRRPARKCIHVYRYSLRKYSKVEHTLFKVYCEFHINTEMAKSGLNRKESAVATLVRIKDKAGLAQGKSKDDEEENYYFE